MSWGADGQDGNGIQLDQFELILDNFFKFIALCHGKTHQNSDYGCFFLRKFTSENIFQFGFRMRRRNLNISAEVFT